MLLVGDRIKADRDTLRKSLQANWRDEYLFVLKQSYDTYLHLQSQKDLYDQQIERVLDAFQKKMPLHEIVQVDPVNKKQKKRKQPKADIRKYLHAMLGVDVIDIPGISEIAALEIVSETGTDRWKIPNIDQSYNERKSPIWKNCSKDSKPRRLNLSFLANMSKSLYYSILQKNE